MPLRYLQKVNPEKFPALAVVDVQFRKPLPTPYTRPLTVVRKCIHLGNLLDRTKCGSEVWACKIHGTCSQQPHRCSKDMALCQTCEQWQSPDTENMPVSKHSAWKPITTRHLLYHIYPVANGHWRWNVEQLCGRLKAFNGQKIISIVTDPPTGRLPDPDGPNSPDRGRHIPGCDSAEDVKAEFRQRWPHDDITFLEMDNDPSLREVKTIMPMLEKVLSDDQTHSLLYAQAKGTTRHHGHIARRWTEALYEIMFDYFPLADKQLMEYPVTGCFKKLGHGWSPEQSRSDWHYSGSWFWVRCAELHRRAWWKADYFWSGIEPYPSQQFLTQESGCMFHTASVPECNLYSMRYWRKVIEPAFNQWRLDNAQYRTTLWPR